MLNKNEPLTESYFYILLCLYQGASHGYRNYAGNRTAFRGTGKNRLRYDVHGATGNMMKKGLDSRNNQRSSGR